MHPGGFEPPTARFVAEYSIQLSYGCIGKLTLLQILIPLLKPYQVRDGASGRITRLRLALRAVAEATLSSLVLAIAPQTMKQQRSCYIGEDGASGRIRTSDRSVRSRVLYPAELRMHWETYLLPILIPLQKPYQVRDGASGRITRLRLSLRAVAEATLSSLVLAITSQTMKQQHSCYIGEDGASGRIRTSDRSVRSRVLYPAELRMHRETYFIADFDTATKAVSSKRWCIREDSNLRPLGS